MRKIFLTTFLFLILFFTILTIYLSTVGIKTSKFNQLINDKIIRIEPRLNTELEEVILILDLPKREIKLETNNTNLYLNNNLIKLSKINIRVDIFSILKKKNRVKNIEITTKENNVKNILNFLKSYKTNLSLILLGNSIEQGSIKTKLNVNFDEKNGNYLSYLASGEIIDVQLSLLNNKKTKNINFNFNITDEKYEFENINFEYKKLKIYSEKLKVIKKNQNYFVEGNLKNKKNSIDPRLLFDLSKFELDLFSNKKVTIETDNEFSFEVNKKLKVKDLQIISKLKFDKLFFNKKYQNLIYFENGTIKTNYSKNNLSIDVFSKYSFIKDKDNNKINIKDKDDIKLHIVKKKDEDYVVKGAFKNKKKLINPKTLFDFFKVKNDVLSDKEIRIETDNNFVFKINKKQKINDLNFKSNLKFDHFFINYDSAVIKRYLKDYKNLVYFKEGTFDIDYSTDKLSVIGKTKYSLDKKFDNLKFELLKNNNLYKFDTTIEVNNSPLLLKSIDYFKDKNKFSVIIAKGNFLKNNKINLDQLLYSENENYFEIDKLKLNQKFKILDLKKVDVNFINQKDKLNNFTIKKNNKNYVLLGKSLDSSDLINDLLKNRTNKRFLDHFDNLNTNLDIMLDKVFLDANSYLENLNGNVEFNKNKIISANLISLFPNKDKFSFSIKPGNNNQKITALYSDNAEPFVKKFNFIKDFKGGKIDFFSIKKNNVSKSYIKIFKFKVRDVPALATLLSLASLQGIADLMTGEGIRFEEFDMKFSNKNDLMTIDEIYAIGPAISILMNGYVEKNSLISLRGTLVPATTLNKVIGSIPFLGKILVGKNIGEGVFGVSFKIKGSTKDLKTTVNPIKTLTPRFITRTLEKIKKN